MKRKVTALSGAVGALLAFSVAFAMVPGGVDGTLVTPGTERTLVLPEAAAGAHFIDLGPAVDPISGKKVQGIAVFHHRNGHNGGPGNGGNNGGGDTSSCYGFLAKDAKWKSAEPWVVNTANIDGLASNTVFDTLVDGISKWEAAAGVDILGDGATTALPLVADTGAPDGVNEVYFADISNSGAIGVTIVWGVFNGPPFNRELVEWDQVYDDVDFDFGDALIDPTKMDFESIATHELGHSVGLDDLYQSECSLETMYGLGSEGEIHARDLNTGDITGITKLY